MIKTDPNKPHEGDENDPTPNEIKRPMFEPKRIVHLSKPLSDSGDGENPTATTMRHDSSSSSEIKEKADPAQSDPTQTTTESSKPSALPTRGDRSVPQFSDKRINPGLRLRALLTSGKSPAPNKPQKDPANPVKSERNPSIYWGVATALSLIVNAILVVVVITMVIQLNTLKTTVNGLFSGLYSNFTEMDNASISTTIAVDTQAPVDFMVPIQQNTDVILTQGVTIPNANIVINSGSFTINSQAKITLPAGTNLPVALNISVPVHISVPVTMQIPVNIPIAQTGLHQSLTGIQNTVRKYYCAFDKNAQYPQGTFICEGHDNPTVAPSVP